MWKRKRVTFLKQFFIYQKEPRREIYILQRQRKETAVGPTAMLSLNSITLVFAFPLSFFLQLLSPSCCLHICCPSHFFPLHLSVSPFLVSAATLHFKIYLNYRKRSLVRSNSLELWDLLLNYAICFSQSLRPGGPTFNIFTHVLQREEERQIKRRGWWWTERKMEWWRESSVCPRVFYCFSILIGTKCAHKMGTRSWIL